MKKLLFLLAFIAATASAQFAPNTVLRATDLNAALAAPNITGGTINNAPIGGTTPRTIAGTQITSTIATGSAPFVVASTTNVANLNASTLSGATFAAPGPIGSTTASTGTFTNLTATGAISLTGLSVATGKTLTVSESMTLTAGAAGRTFTFPSTSAVIARTDLAQTFTGNQTFSNALQLTTSAANHNLKQGSGFVWTTDGTSSGTTTGGAYVVGGVLSMFGGSSITGVVQVSSTGTAVTGTQTVSSNMGIGGAANAAIGAYVTNTALTGTSQYGVGVAFNGSSSATSNVAAFLGNASTAATAFTAINRIQFLSSPPTKGAGSTITNDHGFYAGDTSQGTNNYGFRGLISSGSNKYNLYMDGTADNYLAGNAGIGRTPNAWGSSFKSADIGYSASFVGHPSSDIAYMTANMYFDGTNNKYIHANYALRFFEDAAAGSFAWQTAPSGSAAGTVTFTNAMTLSSAGLLATTGAVEPASNINIRGAQNGNVAKMALTRSDRSWSIANETNLRFYTQATDTVSPSTLLAEMSSTGLAVTGLLSTTSSNASAYNTHTFANSASTGYVQLQLSANNASTNSTASFGYAPGSFSQITNSNSDPFNVSINGTTRTATTTTGFAVTGTLSATGDTAVGSTNADPFSRSPGRALGMTSASGNAALSVNAATGNAAEVNMGVNATRVGYLSADATTMSLNTLSTQSLNLGTNNTARVTINGSTGNVTTTGTLTVAGAAVTGTLSGTTASLGGGALLAGACTSGTVSVTGATTAMAVAASPVTYPGDGAYWMGYVSSANTVTVKVCAAVALTPTASTYNVRVNQ